MREGFLGFLDPAVAWSVDRWEERGDHVWSGLLRAGGEARYPIIDGIPRLFTGHWLATCFAEHREFVEVHRDRLKDLLPSAPAVVPDRDHIKARTRDSFGEEWKRFHTMLDSYKRNHAAYFAPHGPEFFRGRTGLDVGCGMGRHVYWACQYGAEMVAVDLSRAVEVAFGHVKDLPGAHCAQADAYHLPFAKERFDFVESIGVVHHMPDPPAALAILEKLVKDGGCLFVYLYTTSRRQRTTAYQKLKFFLKENVYRELGHRLPRSLMSPYALAFALAGRVMFNVPYWILAPLATPGGRLERMPLRYYADYPLYVLHSDVYDWVAAPLRAHYDRKQVEELFAGLPFQRIDFLSDPEWRVFAWKGPARTAPA